jgi:ABC-type glycerol-3-phosphate transport system substrate-binding protein
MTNRRLACAAAAVGLALAGCGSSSSDGTSSLRAFRSSFAAAKRQLDSISVDLHSAITHAGRKTDAQLAPTLSALASRAEKEASALEQLYPPTRYNTRLRALGSALDAVGVNLSNLSAAAAEHNRPAAESATKALRADAATLKLADATVSKSLGLPAG